MHFKRKPERVWAWPVSDVLEFADNLERLHPGLKEARDWDQFRIIDTNRTVAIDDPLGTEWRYTAGWVVLDTSNKVRVLPIQEFYDEYEEAH